ncbi:hypothetical protein BU24DRAFT_340010, partial [Aaosphaeria arxii CBS 175.79]
EASLSSMLQSSPPMSEEKARAIRELSRSLSHSPRPDPSLSPAASDSNPTQQFGGDSLDFEDDPDFLASTQHRIDDETNELPTFPRIRSTAKKINSWQGLRSEQPIPDTSMVNKQFGDFDQSISDEDDISIEQGRGLPRSNRSTPAKGQSFGAYNSFYDMTPPSARSRKSHAAETGSLRRDAQLRRASRNDLKATAARPASTRNSPAAGNVERKRASLAQLHAKVSEDESSFMDERPPTVTLQSKSTRWGSRSRQTSLQMDGMVDAYANNNTNAQSRPTTAQNATAQSFMLPDIPNLTELVSGVFDDGAPMFSKSTPARTRFAAPRKNGRARGQANYYPIDSLPVPDEEKAIFTSLQLLQERVAQLEHERAEAEKKIEDQEIEIIELRASAQARGGRDSALGSTDGEGSGKSNWKVDKTRLEASVQTLRTKLARAERKVELSEIEKNRRNGERDTMATRLGVASQNFEELKMEKEALSAENGTLRQEIDRLREENEALLQQLAQEQDHYREETAQLQQRFNRAGNDTQKENETLRAELKRMRSQNEENTQTLFRREAELRKARSEQADYVKLKADNDALKEQMAELKAKQDQERLRWASLETDLKDRVAHRDETIRHFYDMTQEQTNEVIREDNEHLRNELARMAVQHEEEARRWSERENKLRKKIITSRQQQTGETLTRELHNLRQNNTTTGTQRQSSSKRDDTRTRIADRVREEVRISKSANASHISNPARSFQKSANRFYSTSQRGPYAPDVHRSVSAPVNLTQDLDGDVESTTDLSLTPRGNPYVSLGHGTNLEQPSQMDLTELSAFNTGDIARLRQEIEEERLANHMRSSVPVQRQAQNDTVRSMASVKSDRRSSVPKKSSMKDLTERTNGTIFEDLTGGVADHDAAVDPSQTHETNIDMSMLSNTSRRRRSAPMDNMTSAFIVPDIKIAARERTIKIDLTRTVGNRSHDNENCSVCRRQAENPSADPLHVPKLIPVSARMPDESDATLRPSRDPKEALALVVKELVDERSHLHMELAAYRVLLEAHDASMGLKKRTAINEEIKDLLRRIDIKDTQIYHLYDVVEGQQGNDITEQDVEELTREIDLQTQQGASTKKDKKVTIQSYIESDEENDHNSIDEEDEELPWEGFEDTATQSINFSKLNSGRRTSAVY